MVVSPGTRNGAGRASHAASTGHQGSVAGEAAAAAIVSGMINGTSVVGAVAWAKRDPADPSRAAQIHAGHETQWTPVMPPVRNTASLRMFAPMSMKPLSRRVLAIVFALAAVVTVRAQEFKATVTVIWDPIPVDQRVDMRDMKTDIERYINSQQYSGADWDGEKIPVSVTIYLMSRNDQRVTARIAIISQRLVNNTPGRGSNLLRVFDQDWAFNWQQNPVLAFNTFRYDELSSVIDFYLLIALGLDMDTYEDLGGTTAYANAQRIAQLGSSQNISGFRTYYQPGEYTRHALITELMDLRYTGMRQLIYDYQEAIDLFARNPEEGRKNLRLIIGDLANYKKEKITNRSVLMQAFFDAKAGEISDIFKGLSTDPVWRDLKYLDAGNTQLYDAAAAGK